MTGPDTPAEYSLSIAGSVVERPEQVISVVVTDEDNKASGVLEKWSEEAWIYADADAVKKTN